MPGSILVVEDDNQLLMLLRLTFKIAEFQIYGASDGIEGLRMALEQKPNLIILDVMLPGMNGIEVCRNVRADSSMKDTIIVMLSARTDDETRREASEVGADYYWTKPFSPTELVERIEKLLRGEPI